MCRPALDPGDIRSLTYIVTHVFFPPQVPHEDDYSIVDAHSLARAVANAARLYTDHVDQASIPQWRSISRMLENLQAVTQSESLDRHQVISHLNNTDVGDVFLLLIKAQNAGVIFRKQKDFTIFESFELSPKAKNVMSAKGKLICSYPGPAIEIPNDVFDDENFRSELVNFLAHMNHDDLHAIRIGFKDTVHPRYITELLTGILRGVGRPADIARITKRIGDEVMCKDSKLAPWRRSSLWLLIRVALQITLVQSPLGQHTYKEFMLFFMCCLAGGDTVVDLPSDLLHFMSAKVSRRLRKLGSCASDWLSRTVLETCTSLRSTIEDRWRQIQAAQCVSPPWNPSRLDLTGDTRLSLLHSGECLRNSLCNQNVNSHDATVVSSLGLKHPARVTLNDFLSSDDALFERLYQLEPYVTLYDVEQEVERGIDNWVDRVTNSEEACMKLETLANKYSSGALSMYANNPELLSVMLLTTIELWVALDKIAIREIPMLADYSPEIPLSLLEHLLICKTASRLRLRHAYQYLSRRHLRNKYGSAFSTTTADSFAIRFYRKSAHLRDIKSRIEEVARHEVREKVTELRKMNARYTELMKREHETGVSLDSMGSMWISVHKWPLPTGRLAAEAVVFELDCPITFHMWRAATFHLLVDLCSPSFQIERGYGDSIKYHHGLQPFLVENPRSRISLGFNTNSSTVSQPTIAIPASRKQVCIGSQLSFFSFDTHTGIPVSEVLGRIDSRIHCTYKLQTGPYHTLQIYVESTTHTSNEVIANQADCHKELSIHEYIAFGHLRSGGSVQWLNILRELRSRSLSFRRPEVYMLLAQAVSQVGPLENTTWVWHQEVHQPAFCRALLCELESLFRDVEANWMEGPTMDTISHFLRHLLATSADQTVSMEALRLLHTVRSRVFSWVQELSFRLMKAPGDEGFRGVLRDTAAICRSTFDVDPIMIPKLLHSAEDINILLSCGIIIHDHTSRDVSQLPAYSQLLLHRDRRLSLALENFVSGIIQVDFGNQGVNHAVSRVWPDYHPGSKWNQLKAPNSRWFSCMTAPPPNHHSQTVYLNILSCSLLVDGKPLGTRLQSKFVRHPLYHLIVGKQTLDVIPADLPGMDYSTSGLISDHRLYFSLRNNDSDLVIRAKRQRGDTGSPEIIELIPHEKLEGDLPAVLIEGHVHWLNLSTSVMEIRPLESIWEASSANWRIDCTPGNHRMWKGREFLVDVRSQSWHMVSSLLRPLGGPQDLIISVSSVNTAQLTPSLQLSVSMPCHDLSFYVDEDGDLQSRNIQGMVYDDDQSIGAFFGLVNQLVLRPKKRDINSLQLVPRCILIPDGDISFKMNGHHVCVEITTRNANCKRVVYQVYKVNTDLGCLTGNASLTSKLYCAYLHALTTGCSADPLTGRSGTEEALSILQSASCWSTMKFSSRDAELLSLIASICPSREWHSSHTAQKVKWHGIPTSSQSHELYILAKGIEERYRRIQLFYEGQPSPPLCAFPTRDDHLLKRSARRAVYIFPSGLTEQPFGATIDVQYATRHLVEIASGEHHAFTAASYVYHRTATSAMNIWKMMKPWTEVVYGDPALSLQYNRPWLTPHLPSIWLRTYDLLRESNKRKWFQMLFSLPAMVYALPKLESLVPVFVAFASHPHFQSENPPCYASYLLSDGYQPSRSILQNYVSQCAISFECSPESQLDERAARRNVGHHGFDKHRLQAYNIRRRMDSHVEVNNLLNAWPCNTPPPPTLDPDLYYLARFTSNVECHFSSCYRNLKFKEHIARIQRILKNTCSPTSPTPRNDFYYLGPSRNTPLSSTHHLMTIQPLSRPAPSLPSPNRLSQNITSIGNNSPLGFPSLHQLIAVVAGSSENSFQHQYTSALRTSAGYLENEISLKRYAEIKQPASEVLVEHYLRCKARYAEGLHKVKLYLAPRSQGEQALEQSGQWPRITAYTLFCSLASNSPIILPDEWKKCLTQLALLALELQRSRRLLRLLFNGLYEEVHRELQNEGCDGWDAEAHSDWLLIQLQGDFLIRRVQAEVANQMISPHSATNTVMQLNMGEGKTSVIIPTTATALSNGEQLVRVIVPKVLMVQTFHLLVDRLGGLVNRRVYILPFSRSLAVSHERMAALHETMLECMRGGGILVAHPEHILSLKLSSVEKQLSKTADDRSGHLLGKLQRWLHSHSRDILDESDEILDVRSQLVFTVGLQKHVEGSPERWTTTEQVLGLVGKYASVLQERFPLGVEYEPGPPGSFPHFRILQADAGQELISRIVQDVLEGLLPNVSFGHLRSGLKDAVRAFILCEHVPPTELHLVKEYSQKTPLWGSLLLLRGLLANGVLLFAFTERRWRVDYGLSPTRTMLAVPYRAKDVPAPRAEFGHTDIAIILTCLSYYYGGLSEEQLKLSFDVLLSRHDPSLDFNLWVRDCPAVPEFLQNLSGINVESLEQWNKSLFPTFSKNQATINFYLSNVVFPREIYEFPSKLSSSGWDLAEKKDRLLTGFSGTNDGQYLLPTHVAQRDPEHQRGTNAKVLAYLLQPENKDYMCTTHGSGKRRTAREFLQVLVAQKPEIRVLLDVGAQMLDLRNHELAQAWLDINLDASAAIYFNEDDELTVCARDGRTELLLSSPYAEQLDRCVVYLDDAHTRGTDIKFPIGFRAAVTLGPNITKDRLVQGCMRMRKLGHGHSVMFFAPLEVDRRIRSVAGKDKCLDSINITDILHWAICETWENTRKWALHWAIQGMDHTSRYDAWSNFCKGELNSKELVSKWIQPEAKSLEDFYAPGTTLNSAFLDSGDIYQHCVDLGVLSLSPVGMGEEQEREFVYELEVRHERQAERPLKVSPAKHSIHQDIATFIKTGVIPTGSKIFRTRSKAFSQAFETLNVTSAATSEAYVWSQSVLVTKDFEQTVKLSGKIDDYLRPIHWIVSAKRDTNDLLVILSPFEVNHLLPDIRSTKNVHLHLYTPRITKSMKPCDDLKLYSIPAVPDEWTSPFPHMDQLNVFAGQLYLKDYEAYIRLCRFLCVYTRELQGEEGLWLEGDGFILPQNRSKCLGVVLAHTFQNSPLIALRALIHLRSKGVNFTSTHMGKLLHGRLLSDGDFDG